MMETTSVVLVGFRDRHEIKQEGLGKVCYSGTRIGDVRKIVNLGRTGVTALKASAHPPTRRMVGFDIDVLSGRGVVQFVKVRGRVPPE